MVRVWITATCRSSAGIVHAPLWYSGSCWPLRFILPQTLPGILSGCVLVFVPAAGLYFISDLLGGGSGMLLGNLINNQLTVSRDWPFGAALSVILIVITFLTMNVYRRYTLSERRDDDA